jgi:polysaccharide export outer membrane protein
MTIGPTRASTVALGLAGLIALSAIGPATAGGRRLTVNDVLQIKVVNQPDLDTTVRVETDGTINFPYVGRIKAAGRTEDAVSAAIAGKLREKDVVKEPQVLVEIGSFGAQASVQGAVGLPGPVVLDRGMTLTQVLSKAGGLKEEAGLVILRRPGPKGMIVQQYPAREIVSGKVDGSRILVFNNDEIYVENGPFFYLYGFVNRPGEYPLVHQLTVEQALSAGGGVGQLGSDWRIRIKRRQDDGTFTEMPASLDDEVQPNDTIEVNERIF